MIELRYIKILLIVLLLSWCTNALAKQCQVYDCDGYELKVCGKNIVCRDYSCENACFDKATKIFREKGGVDGVGYGLKYFAEENKCDCPVEWHKCMEEKYYNERLEKCGSESLCSMYRDQDNDCVPEW